MATETFVTALSALFLANVHVTRSYWRVMLFLAAWTLTRPLKGDPGLLDEIYGILSALLAWGLYQIALRKKKYPKGMIIIPREQYFCGAPMTEKSIREFVKHAKPTSAELAKAFLRAAPNSAAAVEILGHATARLKHQGMLD